MAATMPVNRDAENSARNGTRYTNDGMVCAASRNGRTNLSAVGLRPIQTPTTTPSATTATVATSTAARVSMVSCHNPIAMIRPRHTAVISAEMRPPMIAAIAVIATKVSHHGELSSSVCSGSSAHAVTTSLMPLVTEAKLVWTQLVTEFATLMMCVPTSSPMRIDPICSDDGKIAISWYV